MSSLSDRKRNTDMTTGDPLSLILRFSLPLILGYTLQQVYAMADTVILGRSYGMHGLAVLGAAGWPVWLCVSFLTNFSQAASLVLAKRFGAGKPEELRRAAGSICLLAVLLGAAMTALFLPAARPLLLFLNCPPEVLEDAVLYLQISFGGLFLLLGYNLFSAFLRAVGDGRTPLYAILSATAVNVVLDLWFVVRLRWGAPGAAAATVLAQGISALVCLWRVRSQDLLRIRREHLRLPAPIVREFFSLCVPMVMQSFVISAGGFVVQAHVNGYGVAFTAGISAADKAFELLETAAIAMAQAVATFVSQNYGAGRFDRIRTGLRRAFVLSVCSALFFVLVMAFAGRPLLSLFAEGEALTVAWQFLMVMCAGMLIMCPMYSLRQALQALGNAMIPLLAAVLQLAARVAVTLVLPHFFGRAGLYFTSTAAWLSSLILIGAVLPGWLARCEKNASAGLPSA